MTHVKKLLASFGAVALAGCVQNPQNFETVPVTLKTPKGKVTCQLYNLETVLWDRAISKSAGLSDHEADQYCRTEGYRIIQQNMKK